MVTEQVSRISGTTRVFGCIADPVGHVRAPTVFNTLFAQQGIDHVMVPINARCSTNPGNLLCHH